MKVYDSVVNPPGTDSVAATATAQAATISSAGTLTEAINSVLKKAKPLSTLAKSQSQARGRQDALWQAFTQVCTLPVTQDPERMRQFVVASQDAYLVYLQAHEACGGIGVAQEIELYRSTYCRRIACEENERPRNQRVFD